MKKFGIVLLVLVAIGGFVWWRAKTPPTVGEDFARLAPTEQAARRDDAKKLQNDVKELARAAQAREKKAFALHVSEAQMNTLLQDTVRSKNAPIKDLRAGISKSGVAVQGQVNYKGFDAVATINGTVEVVENRMRYRVDSLQIGGLPAPSKFKDEAEKQVTENLNKYLARAPGRISSVTFTDDEMIISGETD